MTRDSLDIVILGLSITSSWGNGHATTYRSLMRELVARGHRVLFLERDLPWYAAERDLPQPPYGRTIVYQDLAELHNRFSAAVHDANLVLVGSYVPDGMEVGEWVVRTATGITAFYDIDTPVTLALLDRAESTYLSAALIRRYDLYLSFTGGPVLARLEDHYGAQRARPLYCATDPTLYYPEKRRHRWHLGYMGTYSQDRQPGLRRLLVEPARRWDAARMVVAGSKYPKDLTWPPNVERIEHVRPRQHRRFYNEQDFALNLTRASMVEAGYSPSVRLFEAAACACPIISDYWEGIGSFFAIGKEILVAQSTEQVVRTLRGLSESQRQAIGRRARCRVLAEHTAAHRALQLEGYVRELL